MALTTLYYKVYVWRKRYTRIHRVLIIISVLYIPMFVLFLPKVFKLSRFLAMRSF